MDALTLTAVLGCILVALVTTLFLLLVPKSSKKAVTSKAAKMRSKKWSHIRIFYGTQTGTAEQFAEALSSELSSVVGESVSVLDLRQCSDPEEMLTQRVRSGVRVCKVMCRAMWDSR